MSTLASIDIQLTGSESPFACKLIKKLISSGWRFDHGGQAFYLPLGDEDYDWESGKISEAALLDIFAQKEELSEVIGVTMMWENTGTGGEFMFFADGSLSVNLSINRALADTGVTQVNWYFDKLVPYIKELDIRIESIQFSETY